LSSFGNDSFFREKPVATDASTNSSRRRCLAKKRKLDTILHVLNAHINEELTPKDIFTYIKADPELEQVNYNTIKGYVRQLHDAGRVLRLKRGYKINRVAEPTLGVGSGVWFGVHGVRFFLPAGRLSESIPSVVEGFLRFDFVVGKEKSHVVVDVVVPKEHRWIHGIDAVCWRFVVDFVKDYLTKYCEVSLEEAWLVQLGIGFDTMGVLLDGVKSVRVFEAEQILVELYNKAWGGKGLRRSAHTLIPVKKSEIEAILFGGLYAYKKGQLDERLNENFVKMSSIVKENNLQAFRLSHAVIERARFEETRFNSLDKSLEALAMGRITDRQLLEKFYELDNKFDVLTQGQLTLDQRTNLLHNTLERYYSSNLLILDGIARHQQALAEKFEKVEIHNDNRAPQIHSIPMVSLKDIDKPFGVVPAPRIGSVPYGVISKVGCPDYVGVQASRLGSPSYVDSVRSSPSGPGSPTAMSGSPSYGGGTYYG